MEALFQECVDNIENAYQEFGLTSGYRFLFTPKDTLSLPTGLMLIGINPATKSGKLEPSYEAGNRFRLDTEKTSDRYRTRVVDIFRELANALGAADWESFMDATLTSNFCPFPSPAREGLDEWNDFSHRLWVNIFSELEPPTTICLGNDAFDAFKKVYADVGFNAIGGKSYPAGWGNWKLMHQVRKRKKKSETVELIRVPHPSRAHIIGSKVPERQRATEWFLNRVREALERWAVLPSLLTI